MSKEIHFHPIKVSLLPKPTQAVWLQVTCVAVVQPDPLPVILAATAHHVVGEVRLCHLICGVHYYLELEGDNRKWVI
jgi:uncharacterized membrane-anchored protein